MGFPLAYVEIKLPTRKLLISAITLFAFFRNLFILLFTYFTTTTTSSTITSTTTTSTGGGEDFYSSLSSKIIREILPVAMFSDISDPVACTSCAICLSDFEDSEEVRVLVNCSHVFHKTCLDRWIECGHQFQCDTCPLCRKALVPDALQESLSQRLWSLDCFGDQ